MAPRNSAISPRCRIPGCQKKSGPQYHLLLLLAKQGEEQCPYPLDLLVRGYPVSPNYEHQMSNRFNSCDKMLPVLSLVATHFRMCLLQRVSGFQRRGTFSYPAMKKNISIAFPNFPGGLPQHTCHPCNRKPHVPTVPWCWFMAPGPRQPPRPVLSCSMIA